MSVKISQELITPTQVYLQNTFGFDQETTSFMTQDLEISAEELLNYLNSATKLKKICQENNADFNNTFTNDFFASVVGNLEKAAGEDQTISSISELNQAKSDIEAVIKSFTPKPVYDPQKDTYKIGNQKVIVEDVLEKDWAGYLNAARIQKFSEATTNPHYDYKKVELEAGASGPKTVAIAAFVPQAEVDALFNFLIVNMMNFKRTSLYDDMQVVNGNIPNPSSQKYNFQADNEYFLSKFPVFGRFTSKFNTKNYGFRVGSEYGDNKGSFVGLFELVDGTQVSDGFKTPKCTKMAGALKVRPASLRNGTTGSLVELQFNFSLDVSGTPEWVETAMINGLLSSSLEGFVEELLGAFKTGKWAD